MTKPPLRNTLIHSACDGAGWLLVGPDANARKANIDAHRTIRITMRSSLFLNERPRGGSGAWPLCKHNHRLWGPDARGCSGAPASIRGGGFGFVAFGNCPRGSL